MSVVTEAWLDQFVAEHRRPESVAMWSAATAEAIRDRVLPGVADLDAILLETVRQHWVAFLDAIAHPDDAVDLVPAGRELAARVAREDLGLPVLLKMYQVGQQACWDFAVSVVDQAPPEVDHQGLLVRLWTQATAWFGASVEQSVVTFQHEAALIARRGDVARHDVVAGVLAGTTVAPSELSAVLGGYPVGGTVAHVALIASALGAEHVELLDATVRTAAAGLGAGAVAVVRPGGRELWAWFIPTVTAARDAPPTAVQGIDADAVRVTVGGPAIGYDGFVGAHRDARAAQRVALSPGRRVGVTRYGDVAALTMLALDHDAARRFTGEVLGRLAEPGNDQLRQTVRAVLTATAGADAVADELGVHKNTVRYRVSQAQRLLGHAPAARAGDLLLALDYFDAFGA